MDRETAPTSQRTRSDPTSERTLEQTTLLFRLRRVIQMRWGAVAGIALAALIAPWFEVQIPTGPVLLVALCVTAYNSGFAVNLSRLHRGDQTSIIQRARRSASLQITVDLVALTVLAHLTGGIESPLLLYYVFHVIIAGIMLPYKMAYLCASFGVALVLTMHLAELTGALPHRHLVGFLPPGLHTSLGYSVGTLSIFASTVYLAAYLSSSITGELRKRQRQVIALNAELQEKASSLEEANHRLRQIDQERIVFLSIASHDIRAPLIAVHSYLDALQAGHIGPLEERQKVVIQRSIQRTKDLLDLVSGLLDVSRIDQGEMIPDIGKVSLVDVIRPVIEDIQRVAAPKRITLTTDLPENMPPVWASPIRLRQVLTNLVFNATQYTPVGGTVCLRALYDSECTRVEVADTGAGIAPDEIERIFQQHYRGAGVKGSGTGLGLFIVRRIVEAHGGTIWVESPCPETGIGSKFVFTLPNGPD